MSEKEKSVYETNLGLGTDTMSNEPQGEEKKGKMSAPIQDGEELIKIHCDNCISDSFDGNSEVDCGDCFFGKLRGKVVVSRKWLKHIDEEYRKAEEYFRTNPDVRVIEIDAPLTMKDLIRELLGVEETEK